MASNMTRSSCFEVGMKDKFARVFEKMQVTCRDVEKLLGDYTDGDLPNPLKMRLDEHICECSRCSDLVQSYNEVISLAGEIKKSEPGIPSEVRARLRASLNQKLGLALSL